jgi:hypothetical protein
LKRLKDQEEALLAEEEAYTQAEAAKLTEVYGLK